MPQLTPEEQRKRLLEAGLDPDKYEVLSQPEYDARTASKLNVVGTKLAENAGALGGGAGAATLASPLLAASAGPQAIVTIPAYIGAVLLGSYLGKKGQGVAEKAILPEEYKNQLDQYRGALNEQRPALSLGTELGSQLLVGRPSPAVLGKAASGLGKFALGAGKLERSLNAAEKAALLATGAGATLGAGVEGANQLVEGKFDPKRLALQAAAGALTTEPTFITKGIGKVTSSLGNKIIGRSIFHPPAETKLSDVAESLPAILHVDNEGNIVDGPRQGPKNVVEAGKETVVAEDAPAAMRLDKEDFSGALENFRQDLGELGYKTVTDANGEHFLSPNAHEEYTSRISQGEAPEAALASTLDLVEKGEIKNPLQRALEEVQSREQGPENSPFAKEFEELAARRGEENQADYLSSVGSRELELARRRLGEAEAPVEAAKDYLESKAAPKVQSITGRNLELMRRVLAKNPDITLEDAALGVKEPKYLDAIGAERGQEAVRAETLPTAEEARAQDWYHGTGAEITSPEAVSSTFTRSNSLFGTGVYLTDNPTIAKSYAKARGGKQPNVYKLRVKPRNVLNLELPLPKPAADAISSAVYPEFRPKVLSDIQAGKRGTEILGNLREAITDQSHEDGIPASEYDELFMSLEAGLRAAGYDALTHIGGIRAGGGKELHNVLVLLDPQGELGNLPVEARRLVDSIAKQTDDRGQAAGEGAPIDDYTRQFAISRGLDVAQAVDPLTIAGSETPLAGKTFDSASEAAQRGIVAVDPNTARLDTAAHELLHTTVRALGALGKQGDKASQRVYDAIVSAAGGEEAIVQEGGGQLAQLLQGKEKGASALKLLDTSLRLRLGGEVTPARLSTYLANLARSTGADLGVSSQFNASEAGASVLPRDIDPVYNNALKEGITTGNLYQRAAGIIDSPIEKLNVIGYNTPEASKITDKVVPKLRSLFSDERYYNGLFSTALQKVRFGGNVTDFLLSGFPGGRKIATALGRSLTENEEDLLSVAMIAKDKLHKLVPEGTSTELSLESPAAQKFLLESLTKAEANLKIKQKMQEIQDNVIIPIQQTGINFGRLVEDNGVWRVPRSQGDYNPNSMSKEFIQEVTSNPSSKRAQAGKKLLYDYWYNRDFKKAEESGLAGEELTAFGEKLSEEVTRRMDNYLKALSGGIPAGTPQYFSALRKAAGSGLPVALIEPNLESRLGSYIRRSARDISHLKNIESDPVTRAILDIPDQTGSYENNAKTLPDGTPIDAKTNPIAHSKAIAEVLGGYGEFSNTIEQGIQTTSRLATSAWLGALSGARDAASSVIRDFAYVPATRIPSLYAKSFRDFGKFFAESFETGVNKAKHAQLEFGENTINSGLETINKFADAVSQLQGRDVAEKIVRGWVYAKGRHLADLIATVPEGKSTTLDRLFNILHAGSEDLKGIRGTPAFNELAKKELAARYVESIQASYDARYLPSISQKGKLSLAFTLQRWNVEMLNRFRREMIEPTWKAGRALAKDRSPENLRKFEGELLPLVQYTLASVLGGVGVKELTQAITRRLSEQPTEKELKSTSHDPFDPTDPQVLGTWVNNLELSGYGGFLSQIVSTVANSALQTPGRGDFGSLPVYEFASSTAQTLRDYLTSVETPDDVIKKLPELGNQLAKNNLQNYRLMFSEARDIESGNARRNQRVFSRLSGERVPAPVRGNPFQDAEYKELDKATTPEEIRTALGESIDRAKLRVSRSDDPRVTAEGELRKIKTPAKSYFPADPKKLAGFVQFLRDSGQLERQVGQERRRRVNRVVSGR